MSIQENAFENVVCTMVLFVQGGDELENNGPVIRRVFPNYDVTLDYIVPIRVPCA